MFLQSPHKRVLFSRTLALAMVGVLSVISILYGSFAFHSQRVHAATNGNLNFQARLENAAGNIAPDGFYNIEFKLYNVSSAGSSLWTETWYDSNGVTAGNDNRVKVVNGYLTVSLGSQTNFPSTINWDQDLWITLNVGGTTQTATPTWDGEMNPRLKLTGVPYAFKANQLAQYNSVSGFTSIVKILQPTVGDQVFQVPDMGAAGTYTICVQGGICGSGGGGTGVTLQATSPGTPDTGNFNISGTGIAAILQAGSFDKASAGTLNIGTTNATDILLGSTSTAGVLTVGQSTASNTINVGNAIIANGNTGTINIGTNGTGTGKTVVTIGSTNGLSSLLLQAGTGNFLLTGATTSTYTIGSATGTGTITLGQSTASNTINVGNATVAAGNTGTINIGTSSTSTGKTVVTIGSTNDGSTTTIQGGSGNISLVTGSSSTAGILIKSGGLSQTAFQIQNANSSPMLNVDATYTANITDPSFEQGTTTTLSRWSAVGSPTNFLRDTTNGNVYQGVSALRLTTTGAAGEGFQTSAITGGIGAGTYTFSFYARLLSGTMASNLFSITTTDSGTHTAACSSGVTLNSNGFQRVLCTVTTTGALTNIAVAKTEAAVRTIYIDGAMFGSSAATAYLPNGGIQLMASVTSPMTLFSFSNSTTAFQIQDATGGSNLLVADTLNNRIAIGQASANYTLDVAGTINGSTSVLTPLLDTASGVVLNIGTNNATGINLNKNVTIASGQYVSLVGGITSTRPASPTEGMLYYDTTTKQLLIYANAKWQADRSNSTLVVGTSASGGASSAVASKSPDGADFVNTSTTSAQTVINNAFAALPATGGSVYLMDGTYIIDGAISLPNKTALIGAGPSTIIKFKNATNATVSAVKNSDTSTGTRITIENLLIDGNASNQTGSPTMHGIDVNIGGGSGSTVREGALVTDIIARNFTTTAYAISLQGANSIVSNSTVSNAQFGIYINGSGMTVSGNLAMDNLGAGIEVFGSYNNVTGNTVMRNASAGIELSFANNNTISGNKVHDNGGATTNQGISLAGNATNNTVSDNDISDSSCSTTCYAIDIASTGTAGNYISNNNHSGSAANSSSVHDLAIGTIYANQRDGSGNLINRSAGGGLSVGKTSATTSADIQGAVRSTALPTPAAVTLSTSGTAGSTTYGYRVSALDGLGETLASTETTIATGNATLTGTNKINISWVPVGGAVQYKVYRSTSAGTPATTGLIATIAGNVATVSDTGLAASGVVPTANTTGNASLGGGSLTLGTASMSNGNLVFANSTNANTVTVLSGVTAGASYALTLPTTYGSNGDCLKQTGLTGSDASLGFGTCGGTASTLQDAYNNSSSGTKILLTDAIGGVVIADASTPIGSSLFTVQNSTASAKFLSLTPSLLQLQDTSGFKALEFDSTTSHLKVFENTSTPTNYADIYYDNAAGEAVFAASTGGTTRVGNGSGNVTISLTNSSDTFQYTKSATLLGAYSSDDTLIRRTISAGANALTGSVLRVESTSTGSGTVSSNILWLNENNTSATGNLILATKGGTGNDKFKVDVNGNVTIGTSATFAGGTFSGTTFTGPGAVSVSAGAGTSLTLTSPVAATWGTTSGALTLQAGGANKIVVKPGTDSSSSFEIQNAGGSPLLVADSAGSALKVGSGDVSPNATPVLLVVDHKSTAGDPTGTNGGMYYNAGSGRLRCYEATNWANCTPGRIFKSADQTISAATQTNINDLTYAVLANTDYSFECTIMYSTAATTTGIGLAVTSPAAPTAITYQIRMGGFAADGTAAQYTGVGSASADLVLSTGVVAATTNYPAYISGVLRNGANPGNLQIRGRSEIAASNAVFKQGSNCTFNEL
jgi:parallel beta-helix repeat protein